MWYVKLFGFLPCLIFGVAPLVADAIVPGMEGGRRNCGDSGNDIYDDLDKRRLLHTALDYFDILGIPHQAQNTRIQQAA